MAVSKAGLAAWQQVAEKCRCPAIDTPDDMWIGQCLHQSRHSLTHRPEFHQVSHFCVACWHHYSTGPSVCRPKRLSTVSDI